MTQRNLRTAPQDQAKPPPVRDRDLVERVRARDPAAFQLIMRRYNQRLFRMARSIVRSVSEAEDVAQDDAFRPHLAGPGGRCWHPLQCAPRCPLGRDVSTPETATAVVELESEICRFSRWAPHSESLWISFSKRNANPLKPKWRRFDPGIVPSSGSQFGNRSPPDRHCSV